MKIKLLVLSLIAAGNVYATQTATTKAIAYQASGFPNTSVTVNGQVTYSITNNSGATQSYIIDRYMCINNAHCTHYHDSITVGAHATNGNTSNIMATATLSTGNYEDEAIIQISGFESSYAKGVNTFYVH
jgi:hypothetical protein